MGAGAGTAGCARSPECDWETTSRISGILEYINRLYTVYTRIFVYDHNGCIVACAHPEQDGSSAIGTSIDAATLGQVRALRTEQDYHVSPFMPAPLYGAAPTYIHHAAIRAPADERLGMGGIGIVFDAAAKFSSMLHGGLTDKKTAPPSSSITRAS